MSILQLFVCSLRKNGNKMRLKGSTANEVQQENVEHFVIAALRAEGRHRTWPPLAAGQQDNRVATADSRNTFGLGVWALVRIMLVRTVALQCACCGRGGRGCMSLITRTDCGKST